MDTRPYWVWLQACLGAANGKVRQLLETYVSVVQFYEMGVSEWRASHLFTKGELEKFQSYSLEQAAQRVVEHESGGIAVVTPDMAAYPEKLRQIYDYPAVLYVKGNLPNLQERLSVAVVGTRHATHLGLETARTISGDLAKAGAVVVSGGAMGVDTAAHCGVLEQNGVTLCVLGCGIGYPYLAENEKMRRKITEKGALLSEYPVQTPPNRWQFPQRNRIISGLCDGTLVVEGGASSGSLITARDAAEQNREVFAVPGNVTRTSCEGTNNLIKSGAKLTTGALDILEEYFLKYPYLYQVVPSSVRNRPAEKQRFSKQPKVPAPQPTASAVQSSGIIEGEWTVERLTDLLDRLAEQTRTGRRLVSWEEFPPESVIRKAPKLPRSYDFRALYQERMENMTPEERQEAIRRDVLNLPLVWAEEELPKPSPIPEAQKPSEKVVREEPTTEPSTLPEGDCSDLSPEAARVFSALEAEPQHLSVLCERTGISCDVLLVAVTELELTDRIASYSGSRYGLPKV